MDMEIEYYKKICEIQQKYIDGKISIDDCLLQIEVERRVFAETQIYIKRFLMERREQELEGIARELNDRLGRILQK